jgi:hypothetical protein
MWGTLCATRPNELCAQLITENSCNLEKDPSIDCPAGCALMMVQPYTKQTGGCTLVFDYYNDKNQEEGVRRSGTVGSFCQGQCQFGCFPLVKDYKTAKPL